MSDAPVSSIADFDQFLREGSVPASASSDFRLFEVGVDDVHDLLALALGSVGRSLYLSMYGYDDDALNGIVMQKVLDPSILVMITLDKSQAGGTHERALLDADQTSNLASFNTHFAIGQSATHQILHTKGGVIDGWLGFEGSVNWSTGGEGTFVIKGQPGGPRYAAQANTFTLFTDPFAISRFTDRLVAEHATAKAQEGSSLDRVATHQQRLRVPAP